MSETQKERCKLFHCECSNNNTTFIFTTCGVKNIASSDVNPSIDVKRLQLYFTNCLYE